MSTSEGVSLMRVSSPYLNSNIPCSIPRKIHTFRKNDRAMLNCRASSGKLPQARVGTNQLALSRSVKSKTQRRAVRSRTEAPPLTFRVRGTGFRLPVPFERSKIERPVIVKIAVRRLFLTCQPCTHSMTVHVIQG